MTESPAVTHAHNVLQRAEIPDLSPARGSEPTDRRAQAHETLLCGLNGHSERGATAFAAALARRLGWRLSLTPLPLEAPAVDQLDDLVAAAAREGATLAVTPHSQEPAWLDAVIGLCRATGLTLVTVPQDAPSPALGDGPILCGLDARGGQGSATRAAARIASATGARLQLVHVSARRTRPERRGPVQGKFDGRMWRALHGLDVPVPVDLVIAEGDPASRLGLIAEQDEAAVLVLGSPHEATTGGTDEDRVVASLLRDSRVPLMIVPERPERTRPRSLR